jgi:threonyl-tRNA synthetase
MSDQLHNIRHTASHVLAQAVLSLYPDAKLAIGPAIDDGFYYDFDLNGKTFSEDDLKELERLMRKMIGHDQKMVQSTKTIAEAREYFKEKKQPYKVELIDDLEKTGETSLGFYDLVDKDGTSKFLDLCKGPHVASTKEIGAVKLLKVAGAYWRGSEKNAMLQRIYGTAFGTQEELDAYLTMLEEAKKRDHRKVGEALDLFTFSDLVGPGLPLWTPRGTLVRNLLDGFVWELRQARGYERVTIPHITKKELYEVSGHWQKFSEELFKITTREGHEFAMKPMNCPHHTQIYNHLQRSYRDLPQRYAETTTCYRDEQTGELHGLSRVRAFSQDDAHVFCRQTQVKDEFLRIWDIIDTFYAAVGFGTLSVRLSLHDPAEPKKYLGTPEMWQQAENAIRGLATQRGVEFVEAVGEAAFYGPKVDFIAKDSLGRKWQVATIQLDVNLPERFDLYCINEKGEKERIVMIHAAIMGSIERFMSIYLEHTAGAFPTWLAPIQVIVAPVSEQFNDAAATLTTQLIEAGVRAELDDSNESVGKKVRAAEQKKVPYTLVMGQKEIDSGELSVRIRGSKDMATYSLNDFNAMVMDKSRERTG